MKHDAITEPVNTQPEPERRPDAVYRVTNKAGEVIHLGVDKGDMVGLVVAGARAPLPFRVVHVNKSRLSVEPYGKQPKTPDAED